ncbi:hypothetical protein J8273_2459 [Carpediemonas membranifera]|uniref:Uncharacterized protein n=1 Tax=Carpediemonas membranifera TaxID=201153 RepID=A0A8J6BAF6_9EUKA|nr:hypothetical protein J8273_2459 [Carpediemonas membranifera]|eukprot:KAG9396107.1 hypothetical protein J8273_2459 [Carpediemonas membranifera]
MCLHCATLPFLPPTHVLSRQGDRLLQGFHKASSSWTSAQLQTSQSLTRRLIVFYSTLNSLLHLYRLVMVFIVACSWLIVSSYGLSPSLRAWFTRYANSVKLWLARTVKTYRDRLQGSLARLEEALAGVGSPAFFQQELAGIHAILNMVNPVILACLPSLFWAAHMGENDGLPVSEAAPRILSCVWAIADGVETLSGLISHFNGEYSMSLRQPRLVPIVPMAPVRPGFMAYSETMGLLNGNFCHRVGINPTLPHATKPLTEEQEELYQNNPRSMGRLLSLSTDGVCVAVTIKRGFGHFRPQHDASMAVRKRAKGREKERPRLGANNADAPLAPDPDAHLMGFDPPGREVHRRVLHQAPRWLHQLRRPSKVRIH